MSEHPSSLVLLHSPLVGPSTWALLGPEMERRGQEVLIPRLPMTPEDYPTLRLAQVAYLAQYVDQTASRNSPILVAHSAAGTLLPQASNSVKKRIGAFVFIDADIPEDGLSHLDLIAMSLPHLHKELHKQLIEGHRYPDWTPDDLADTVPDPGLRKGLVQEIRPQPLEFFQEPISVPSDWPDAPCAYLQLSEGYTAAAKRAKARGWPTIQIAAGHFHMLVDPHQVATALMELLDAVQKPNTSQLLDIGAS